MAKTKCFLVEQNWRSRAGKISGPSRQLTSQSKQRILVILPAQGAIHKTRNVIVHPGKKPMKREKKKNGKSNSN